MKTLFTTICIALLFQTNLIAQDEDCPECGWYVDGIKVEKIDCYSFDKLQVVLPYNDAMKGYDQIDINFQIILEEKYQRTAVGGERFGVKFLPGSALGTLVKGKYIVFTVFSKELGNLTTLKDHSEGFINPSKMNKEFFTKKRKKEQVNFFKVFIVGNSIASYKYDTGSKVPVYSYNDLSKKYTLTCLNNINEDATIPCTYPGTKADLNNLPK